MKHQLTSQINLITLTLTIFVFIALIAGCYQHGAPGNLENTDPGDTVILLKPKHPTHKVACSCTCGESTETHDLTASGSCADLNGVECSLKVGTDKLTSCKKKSVPAAQQVLIANEILEAKQ